MKYLPIFSAVLFITLLSVSYSQEEDYLNTDDDDAQNINYADILNMDQSERDRLLACTEIITNKLKKEGGIIEGVTQALGGLVEGSIVSQKITGDMLNKCYFSIDEASVHYIFKDGVLIDPEVDEELLKFVDVDYSIFQNLNPNEFQLTPETQFLFMKLEKAREDYIVSTKKNNEKQKNAFHLFGFNLKNIPIKVNIIISFVIIVLIVGGLLLLLKSVMTNEKKAGKKKSK